MRHNFGRQLTIQELSKPQFLSRGRLANRFASIDRSTTLYEFITPDLDGIEDEVPISTLYYSKNDD